MTGRVFSVPIVGVSVSVVQDLFSLQSTSGMAFRLLEIDLGQITTITTEILRLTIKRFSGAYTIGSGGSSVTPVPHNEDDAAATVTARINDTTQTTGGTGTTIRATTWNEVNGYGLLAIPEKELIFKPSRALVVSLDTAPGAARTVNGTIVFEELF